MAISFTAVGIVDNTMIQEVHLNSTTMQGTVTYCVTWLGDQYRRTTDATVFTFNDLAGTSALAAWARAAIESHLGL